MPILPCLQCLSGKISETNLRRLNRIVLGSSTTKTLLVASSFKVGLSLYKNTSVVAGFSKGLPDGTICNGANVFFCT